MQNVQFMFGALVSGVAIALCGHRHDLYKRDADHKNDDQHLLDVLKDHDIVPDILDDVSGTSSLEVKISCIRLMATYCLKAYVIIHEFNRVPNFFCLGDIQ